MFGTSYRNWAGVPKSRNGVLVNETKKLSNGGVRRIGPELKKGLRERLEYRLDR